ncbi:MAG: ABC transporter permease [Bryobacteraceae bacterium]
MTGAAPLAAIGSLATRLILRPLWREKLRTALTIAAVALGVAVVIAIRLSGDAAAGSFRSSMRTLSGPAQLELRATGGIDEKLLGSLVRLPGGARFQPRMEGYAVAARQRAAVPLIGLDLLQQPPPTDGGEPLSPAAYSENAVWLGGDPWTITACDDAKPGVELAIQDAIACYPVAGRIPNADRFVLMDIGAAQQALKRPGLLDRIEVILPDASDPNGWRARIEAAAGNRAELRDAGADTLENRKMLAAFRWNLRALSYISLVVGAFLIYNTISVSVVRRRNEVGILRAIGVTRGQILALFLGEAGAFGLIGGTIGLVLGRVMAEGTVRLVAGTVEQLYVSSSPGDLVLTPAHALEALVTGLAVAILAALGPSIEASRVAPVEAMARGRRELHARMRTGRDLIFAVLLAAAALWAARAEPWDGRPIGGYAACFCLIAASALAIPAAVTVVSRSLAAIAGRVLGVEGLLAARSLTASLPRTSVLTGALSTAVAMMVSVGIMVGSFRETVETWMDSQLQADFYIRPAGGGAAGRHPTFDPAVADRIEALPGVRDVDRFRLYDISYRGLPAFLGGGETAVIATNGRTGFLPGEDRDAILDKLPRGDFAIVSEPFANKHGVRPGDRIELTLGGARPRLEVLGVYFDYSSERGYVIVDRSTLLRHLPDPAPSSLAVYRHPAADEAATRVRIEQAAAGHNLLVFSHRRLRQEALAIFDRTFAITWALEAVAIFVAVLGVAGALLSLVIDRRRELALLRFLGGSAGQIRKLILAEAGLLGLLSNAAGFLLGAALSLILIYVINVQSFGWTIRFHWPAAMLIAALSGIYAATIVAGLYPSRVAIRMNPIEVIHEE